MGSRSKAAARRPLRFRARAARGFASGARSPNRSSESCNRLSDTDQGSQTVAVRSPMLNDIAHSAACARRKFDAPGLRLVVLGERVRAEVRGPKMRRGTPRTVEEWTALAKVGSGEADIPPRQAQRLVTLGLAVTISGRAALTRHGRFTLGLAE